ncbi:unnamed protein product [Microthlaspi erraticum]|uniref:Uncharacterized protein n=1 Tax=Microthlaspi erraticum TaxID=1685480 RepID=A0A6D2KS24_9BRAS|nr:unnamed protein product [Microthlaspi erraticum]
MQQEALSFLSSSFPSHHHHFPSLSRLRFHNFPALSFKPNTSTSSLFFPPKSPDIPSLPSTTTETLESDIHEKLLYLDSLGIDFLTLINRHPPLLSAALSAIKSVVDYMTTPPINFTLPDFRRLVSMCPELLTSPLTSHTIPVITFLLREVGVDSVFDLRQALRRRPILRECKRRSNFTNQTKRNKVELHHLSELMVSPFLLPWVPLDSPILIVTKFHPETVSREE